MVQLYNFDTPHLFTIVIWNACPTNIGVDGPKRGGAGLPVIENGPLPGANVFLFLFEHVPSRNKPETMSTTKKNNNNKTPN